MTTAGDQLIQCSKTTFTNQEWDRLTTSREELPPCCDSITRLASIIRSIRSYDLDIINAREFRFHYNNAACGHDLTMFPLLMRLKDQCDELLITLKNLRHDLSTDELQSVGYFNTYL